MQSPQTPTWKLSDSLFCCSSPDKVASALVVHLEGFREEFLCCIKDVSKKEVL